MTPPAKSNCVDSCDELHEVREELACTRAAFVAAQRALTAEREYSEALARLLEALTKVKT